MHHALPLPTVLGRIGGLQMMLIFPGETPANTAGLMVLVAMMEGPAISGLLATGLKQLFPTAWAVLMPIATLRNDGVSWPEVVNL